MAYNIGDTGTYTEIIDDKTITCNATVIKNVKDENDITKSFISVDALGKVVEATDDNFVSR